jgi:hypothetical protein
MDRRQRNTQTDTKPNILLIVPCIEAFVHCELAQVINWWTINDGCIKQFGLRTEYVQSAMPVDFARNLGVQMLLKDNSKFTHILYIDNDIIPPMKALLKMLRHDKPVVAAACYMMEYINYEAYPRIVAYKDDEFYEGDGLEEVDAVTGGCFMVKREVLEAIELPAFKFKYNEDGLITLSEDLYFAEKVKQAGFKLYTDFNLKCEHYRPIRIGCVANRIERLKHDTISKT